MSPLVCLHLILLPLELLLLLEFLLQQEILLLLENLLQLEKILLEEGLNQAQKTAAQGHLISRLKILINGAVKRNNQAVIEEYSGKLENWESSILQNNRSQR